MPHFFYKNVNKIRAYKSFCFFVTHQSTFCQFLKHTGCVYALIHYYEKYKINLEDQNLSELCNDTLFYTLPPEGRLLQVAPFWHDTPRQGLG